MSQVMKRGYAYSVGIDLFQVVLDKKNRWWRRCSQAGSGFGAWEKIFPPNVLANYTVIRLDDGSTAQLRELNREPTNLPL
jgi:hypothetical protein